MSVLVYSSGGGSPGELARLSRWCIAMLRNAVEAERAERDQDADCARIEAAVDMAKQAITALEHQQLDTEEIHEKWSAIRDQTIFVIREVRRNIIRRAKEAEETERSIIQKFWQEQSDGGVIHAFSAELQKVPTQRLLDYLRYLIQVDDLARIQSLRMVFKARVDHRRHEPTFDGMLAQFARAKCGDLGERLVRICRLAQRTDAIIANLLSAQGKINRSCEPTPHQQVEAR